MALCKNPILPGFYPDPSICRVGSKYYLVNSTFSYFPGVPIFESENLIDWKQIGNVLNRNSQLPLFNAGHSRGIFAPTIRYNDGIWYMITTNISGGGNFIVTSKDPRGPWSEPYYLGTSAKGIDPSLFFDDDGKCYYVGTRENPQGATYNGDWEIWAQELNLETMSLVGESFKLWKGSQVNVIWPEGPHIYKKDGYYYLLHAEGGTGIDHCISIARSREVFGPYENNPKNPIFTHRHLGVNYPITNVGHGDMVETENGEWFMVMLASRPIQKFSNLGRETFLTKVTWENDWPVVNVGVGVIEEIFSMDNIAITNIEEKYVREYSFEDKKIPLEFLFLRNPEKDSCFIDEFNVLNLKCQSFELGDIESISYVSVRQKHWNFEVFTKILLENLEGCKAGLVLMQNDMYNIEYTVDIRNDKQFLAVIKRVKGEVEFVYEIIIKTQKDIEIGIEARGLRLSCYYFENGDKKYFNEDIGISELSTEVAGGFVGCTTGMYANSKNKKYIKYAKFSKFGYREL